MGKLLIPILVPLLLLALAPAAGSPPRAEPAVTLVAVGDVQLGRGVGRLIERHGPDCPFEHVRGIIQEADLALLNLECALSAEGTPIKKRFSFKADPIAADGLARAGFDVAILANNHSVDCGRWTLPETIDTLTSKGIAAVGGGANMSAAADSRWCYDARSWPVHIVNTPFRTWQIGCVGVSDRRQRLWSSLLGWLIDLLFRLLFGGGVLIRLGGRCFGIGRFRVLS